MARGERSRSLVQHLPEYGMEAAGLGAIVFVSAVATAIVVERLGGLGPLTDRAIEASCISLTVLAMTYSPWGRRSGAHYNPAVTLTFLALRRINLADALCYIAAQCAGAFAGIAAAALIAGAALRYPPVTWIVTLPGPAGAAAAFAGEFAAALLLMSSVLAVGGIPSLVRLNGLFAAILVFIFICVEAPLSGFSMNPARSLASALPAGQWHDYWIYVLAPPAGMLGAAALNRALPWMPSSRCAKVQPGRRQRCIHCGFQAGGEPRCPQILDRRC
jgi:aquaporin Z